MTSKMYSSALNWVVRPSQSLGLRMCSSSAPSSPSKRSSLLKPAFFKPKLVIFDKDGTLVCFHTMWTPWCTSLAQRMQKVTGLDLADTLYDVLGYDHNSQRVKIGALAENTHPQIREQLENMLQKHRGFTPSEARLVVNKSWKDTPENMEIKTTGDVNEIFENLKREDVKIAICTSDSREGTVEFLDRENLTHLVDLVVCGDDSFSKPKPDPHNAAFICQRLGVRLMDTIMVGDTPADTLMGQQANVGLTVGVLSGVGDEEDLRDADVIVSDVNECVNLILPGSASVKRKVHQVTTRGLAKIAQRNSMWNARGIPHSTRGGTRRAYSTTAIPGGQSSFSHIVIGAGSAGCVLANRLTEERQEDNTKLYDQRR